METSAAEQQQLRAALDAALATTFDFGIRKLRDPRWHPAPHSEASAELASGQLREDGQPWGDDVLRTPYAAASLLMTGVLDNLGSIRQLIDDPMPAIGPTLIARSAMEIGATTWWLMEPGIGARRRTCRQLVLSLVSARRAGQVAEELRDDEARRQGLAQEDRVLAQIRRLAISQPTGTRYRPVIEGESFPEATDLTARMLEPCYPGLAGTRSFYRSYSAVLHGQLYGLMNFMTPASQDDGSILLSWQLRGSVLYGAVEVALLSFREPFKRISQHMGWGRLEYDLWLTRVSRSLDVVTRRGSWHLIATQRRRIYMSPAPTMTFPFQELSDAKGLTTFRPVIPLRPMSAPLGSSERCLVDTGSPNTYLDWRLAPLAGVELSQAEKVPDPQQWSIGGVAAEELWAATAAFMIPDGRYMIRLGDVSVVLVKPWLHPDFTAVLGTDGMRRIGLIVDAGAGNGQLTVVQR